MAQRVRPKLTTVANPTATAGRTAVDMLLQLGDDRRATAQVSLHTELIVRDSTGPGPHAADDPGHRVG
jgi:LacI family transcriptional regulator